MTAHAGHDGHDDAEDHAEDHAQDLRRADARLPDERPRQRAPRRPARDGGLRRPCQPAAGRATRGRRRRRLQHLRRAGERRQQALRQPGPAPSGQAAQPRDADRRRWLHGPEGPRHHRRAGSVGRCRLRHAQPRLPAGVVGPGGAQQARRGGDPREPGDLPVDLADASRLRLQRVGLHLRRLQQHVHVLHRAESSGQGAGPPPGRDPRRGRGPRRAGRRRDHPVGAERQHLRGRVRRPARLRPAAARLRRDRRARAGPLHEPAPGRLHGRRHPRNGRDAERHAEPAHAAPVWLRQGPEGHAPLLPQRQVPPHPRHRPRSHPAGRDHDRHHRRVPGGDRGRLPGHARRRARRPASRAPSPSSTPSARALPLR